MSFYRAGFPQIKRITNLNNRYCEPGRPRFQILLTDAVRAAMISMKGPNAEADEGRILPFRRAETHPQDTFNQLMPSRSAAQRLHLKEARVVSTKELMT